MNISSNAASSYHGPVSILFTIPYFNATAACYGAAAVWYDAATFHGATTAWYDAAAASYDTTTSYAPDSYCEQPDSDAATDSKDAAVSYGAACYDTATGEP